MGLLLSVVLAIHKLPSQDKAQNQPTFYRDELPIIQGHCQVCHRAGGNAPMPFETYEQTRPFAAAIRVAMGRFARKQPAPDLEDGGEPVDDWAACLLFA